MTETRIYRFAAVVAALFAGVLSLGAQTVPDTLRQTDRIMSRMDSLQKAMRGRKDTLRTRPAWTAPALLARADSLRRAYSFAESVNAYREALRLCDSTESGPCQDSLLLGQNALSMMGFCSQPVVVARKCFSRKDFFLYYPLKDHSWRPCPNPLDSLGRGAMYIDPDARTLYYSATDEDGICNLYRTRDLDSLWSVPELINEQITSQSDEIFPMLSADGESLYFASRGLYGMGGYDLYVSHWNKETRDWDVPVNLGFPYSSPADDFLFVNSDDGKYSIFASNRDCTRDSVYIYVLEFDSMPVRQALDDERQVRRLSHLRPSGSGIQPDRKPAADPVKDNPETREYMRRMNLVRALRDSISAFGQALDEERAALSLLPEEQRAAAMEAVLQKEMALPAMNDSLKRATAALQQIEMEFLMKGVVIDPTRVKAEAKGGAAGAASDYVWTRRTMGPALDIRVQKPKPTFDYTFMVLPEGRFAEDNTLPSGLVYQIQLFSSASKATVKQLRGLSPVFEKTVNPQRHTYSVGVFRSYKDVLANLNKVKRQGFRSAFIVAYNDGKSISVQQARNLEKTLRPIFWVKVYPPDGQALPSLALTAIQQQGTKDIMRGVEDGSVVFTCGSFANRDDAEALRTSLRALGVSHTEIEEVHGSGTDLRLP